MAKNHGNSVKNDKQYEGLRKKGMSKQRAASIANSPDSSHKGGRKSGKGSGGSRSQRGRCFGDVPTPEETLLSDWTADPFALGSYSYVPVGASPDDMRRLGEPLSDRLILCGEATVPDHDGTVQAGFLSGLRGAEFALGVRPEQLSFTAIPALVEVRGPLDILEGTNPKGGI